MADPERRFNLHKLTSMKAGAKEVALAVLKTDEAAQALARRSASLVRRSNRMTGMILRSRESRLAVEEDRSEDHGLLFRTAEIIGDKVAVTRLYRAEDGLFLVEAILGRDRQGQRLDRVDRAIRAVAAIAPTISSGLVTRMVGVYRRELEEGVFNSTAQEQSTVS
jgi:hypothetical protein